MADDIYKIEHAPVKFGIGEYLLGCGCLLLLVLVWLGPFILLIIRAIRGE